MEIQKSDLLELLTSEHKPTHYDDMVASHNQVFHNNIKKEVMNYVPELSQTDGNFALAMTGSDGRHEKSPRSLIELILLHKDVAPEQFQTTNDRLYSYVAQQNWYEPIIECKDVYRDSCLTFLNHPDKVFPTRALDAKFIAGNKKVFGYYKDQLVPELKGPEGKKKLKRFDDRRRESRHALIREDKINSFDQTLGELYFDDDRVKATKYSHLRPVQYKLAADIFKALRKGTLPSDFLEQFPRRTFNRLGNLYFQDHLTLSSTQVNDVSEAYSQSLYWFHLAEERYVHHGESTLSVGSGELTEVSNIIRDFSGIEGSIIK